MFGWDVLIAIVIVAVATGFLLGRAIASDAIVELREARQEAKALLLRTHGTSEDTRAALQHIWRDSFLAAKLAALSDTPADQRFAKLRRYLQSERALQEVHADDRSRLIDRLDQIERFTSWSANQDRPASEIMELRD